MSKTRFLVIGLIIGLISFMCIPVFAAPPDAQTIGGVTRQERDIEKKRAIEKKIGTERPKASESVPEEVIPSGTGPKVLINKILVDGVTLLPADTINGIIATYQGKELSLEGIQKVADLITDEYRKKGFVTSRAYIPPQTIKDGILIIKVVEGKLGALQIQGNRYFRTALLEKKIGLTSEGYFDYSALQRSLVYINEHPDRKARATLVPGKTPGTTDVVINVTDKFPMHVGFEYDNYGSRYIEKNRYSIVLENNNLFGFDDKLYYKIQKAEANRLTLQQLRYVFPISSTWSVGAYAVHSKLKLGKEFRDIDAKGRADIIGFFTNKALISKDNLDLRYNLGMDFKKIRNYLLGAKSSEDRLSVLKNGFDVDFSDPLGRNILLTEVDLGIPHFMGAMNRKDINSSRAGGGGQFTKWLLNLFRLQPLPLDMALLWKNSAQYSNNSLVASEEFQIGGPTSVRGYTPAEYSGDKGYYTALELSAPVYGISKNVLLPFTQEKLYDSLRLVAFYDFATAHSNTVAAGEKKHQTLKGYGFGVRFNIKDNVSLRVEIGYPIGKTPSDGDHAHPWVELITRF